MGLLIDKIIYTKSKSIKLTVLNDGSSVLYQPYNVSQSVVDKFIQSKEKWLNKHKSYKLNLYNKYLDVINYNSVSILNKIYPIEYASNNKKTQLIGETLFTIDKTNLIKFMKKLAQDVILKRAQELSSKLNIIPKELKIENSKTRWGVCTSSKDIKLNFRLICLSPQLVDYVIIHELMHLIEFNHSKDFWYLIGKIIPNYNTLKKQLKEFSFLLEMYR